MLTGWVSWGRHGSWRGQVVLPEWYTPSGHTLPDICRTCHGNKAPAKELECVDGTVLSRNSVEYSGFRHGFESSRSDAVHILSTTYLFSRSWRRLGSIEQYYFSFFLSDREGSHSCFLGGGFSFQEASKAFLMW